MLRDLMKIFPNAKVVVTTRDPSSWHDSLATTVIRADKLIDSVPAKIYKSIFGGFEVYDTLFRANSAVPKGLNKSKLQ